MMHEGLNLSEVTYVGMIALLPVLGGQVQMLVQVQPPGLPPDWGVENDVMMKEVWMWVG